jgi:hypothetical protein
MDTDLRRFRELDPLRDFVRHVRCAAIRRMGLTQLPAAATAAPIASASVVHAHKRTGGFMSGATPFGKCAGFRGKQRNFPLSHTCRK